MGADDRIKEIEEQLENDDLSSHKRDKLKRELNKLQSQQNDANGVGVYRTLGIAVLALAIIVGGGYALASTGMIQFDVNNAANAGEVDPSQIAIEDQPMMGDPDAPVTIVEYGDFQCPACQRFESTADRLQSDFVDSGDANFVWKDFPLTQIHDWAQPAAETLECVYRQDEEAFWPVKEQVFANQGQITTGNVHEQIISFAEEEGVDGNEIDACLDNNNPGEAVSADMQEGQNIGVTGTPTVFINGNRMPNQASYQDYVNTIEQELNAQE